MSDSPEVPRKHHARRRPTPAGGVFGNRAGHRR
ncbi:hypothetical protein J2S44_006204 [Catenuloplanes niger]|uniref:Uncharacterized protein n=1 Tax=Catenuloplanes niger TaxID=587534 RepID=A0AAE3ZTT6_9ACTN|nr:hypothetical protein [Catenuloplanes niger]